MEDVLSSQPMIPPKRFDIFPPVWDAQKVKMRSDFFSPVLYDPILLLIPSGKNPFKCHGEVLYLQPMIRPKRFDIFLPDWGILRRSRRVQIIL